MRIILLSVINILSTPIIVQWTRHYVNITNVNSAVDFTWNFPISFSDYEDSHSIAEMHSWHTATVMVTSGTAATLNVSVKDSQKHNVYVSLIAIGY